MGAALQRVLCQVSLEQPVPHHPCAQAFVEASLSAGFPLTDFAMSPAHHGVGWHQLNKRGRVRQSSAVAYLQPLDRLPSTLHVASNLRACRLTLDGTSGVTGVETTRGVIRSRLDVVVCAGALGSPELLLRSGIGPGEHLAAMGVSPQHELAGVGEHLIDHPEATVMWAAKQAVSGDSVNHFETSLFAALGRDGRADVQVMFGTARLEPILQVLTKDEGKALPAHVFAMYPNVARAQSQGRVCLRSSDSQLGLSVDPCYYTDADGHDLECMVEGIRLARDVAAQPALQRWIDYEIAPGRALSDDDALARYARRTVGTVYHQAGTCRMGRVSDCDAVVGADLRVIGLLGVRIADASIFPSMPAVNPCLTCMAVGELCADLLIDRPSHDPSELDDSSVWTGGLPR